MAGKKRGRGDDDEEEEEGDIGSQAKVAREDAGPVELLGDADLETCEWPLKSGMILEVNLRNFMCHETFNFKPCQRVNFLVGENGSGKSAVLTAIIFGLGGSAKTSNRGTNNRGFIRSGQASASVEVKLCNVGENQYKLETYGKSLTIIRTVTHSSSTYKIKDHNGTVVVDKKVKEEVDNILTHFNIQIENPIVMLNQDASKSYLSKSNPTSLYTLFHKSTCLEEVEKAYDTATADKENAEFALDRKKQTLPQLQKEYDNWKKKWEFFENLETRQEEVVYKKRELAWALVRDAENDVQETSKSMEKDEKKMKMADREVEGIKERDKATRANKKEIEDEIQSIAKSSEPDDARLNELKQAHDDKKRRTQQVGRAVAELLRKKGKVQKNLDEVSKAIDEFKNGKYREFQEKARKRSLLMEQLTQETEALTAQIETAGNHLTHLKSNKREADHNAANAKHELTSKNSRIGALTKEIRDLQSGEQSKLNAFGPHMSKLVNEINRCNKFEKKPIGPLGALITLKDNVPKETATVVEGEIGGLLSAFCCNSNRDQMVLFDIFRKLGLQQKPTIITSEFSSTRHDISRKKVAHNKYRTLVDCIEVEEPTVFNALVDNAGLERIITISSATEAQNLLSNQNTAPRNLKYAVVGGKHLYFPAPNYKSYYKEYRVRNILQSSIVELIVEKNAEIDALKEELAQMKVHLHGEHEKVREAAELLQSEENKIKMVRDRITKKNTTMRGLQDEEYAEQPPDVAALEDDKERFSAEVEGFTGEINDKQKQLAEEKAREAEAAEERERLERSITERLDMIEPLNQKLTECEEGIRKNKRDIDYYNNKKAEYRQNINTVVAKVKVKETELEELFQRAQKWCEERVDSRKKVESLRKEVVILQGNIDKLQDGCEPKDVVRANYTKYHKVYQDTNTEIVAFSDLMDNLNTLIARRKKGYQIILRSTAKNVNSNFTCQLHVRNFVGDLDFNHDKKALIVKVCPSNSGIEQGGMNIERDLKSLSGGERSFTLVSLILGLWNLMEPPFRILDEFDVFMDAVNRRISVQNIIKYAREDRKNQFLFLTPLNTDNISTSNDIRIIQLKKRQQ